MVEAGTLAEGQLGPETRYLLKFEGGKLIAQAGFDGAQFDAEVALKLDAIAVIDALVDAVERAVPGDQTALATLLKGAVKAVAA